MRRPTIKILLGILALAVTASAAPKIIKELSHCEGRKDEQTIYGERGCVVAYDIGDDKRTWYATEVRFTGETYGDYSEAQFVVAFMDMQGNVFGDSSHYFDDHFKHQEPVNVRLKIDPVEVPSKFRVVVNFFPSKELGAYMGYVNGGGHSMLCDKDYNLYEMEDDFEWCVDVTVRDTLRKDAKILKYAPENFTKKAKITVPEHLRVKNVTCDRALVIYKGLDDVWGKSLARIVDSMAKGYEGKYGFKPAQTPIKFFATIDKEAPAPDLSIKENGEIHWVLKVRADLLPVSRGGKIRHLFNFSREMARLLFRDRLLRSEFAPEGQDTGLASVLAGDMVEYLYKAHGRGLWPVPFSYHMEEGEKYLEQYVKSDSKEDPAIAYAKLFWDIKAKLGAEAFQETIKGLFEKELPARDLIRVLYETMKTKADEEWLAATFPKEFIDPPMVWRLKKPDLSSMDSFQGLNVKKYKTMALLSYDSKSIKGEVGLSDEEHALICPIPKGAWRIKEIRIFGKRKEGVGDVKIKAKLFNNKMELIQEAQIQTSKVDSKKNKWRTFTGFPDTVLKAPFYLTLSTGGEFLMGLSENQVKSHSMKIWPQSHVAPVEGKSDWMVRLYLTPDPPLDKDALNKALIELRRGTAKKKR